jgi:hypothetical protein
MKQFAAAAMLLVATNGLCQSLPKDNETLQSLMSEIHQLRMDIEAMTVASQRVQIVLYQLQMEDAAVARATQRIDSIHDKCASTENTRPHTPAGSHASTLCMAAKIWFTCGRIPRIRDCF